VLDLIPQVCMGQLSRSCTELLAVKKVKLSHVLGVFLVLLIIVVIIGLVLLLLIFIFL
jgi:hypothetical protein